MIRKIFFVALSGILAINILAQEKKFLTVRDIYEDPALNNKEFYSFKFAWKGDTEHLTYFKTVNDSAKQLVGYDPVRKNEYVILDGNDLVGMLTIDDIKNIQWSPDGENLVTIKDNDIYIVDVKNKRYRRLTKDGRKKSDVRFSNNGEYISFIKNHNLWLIDLKTEELEQITTEGNDSIYFGELDWVYPEELQISSGYCWSPDDKYIAFLKLDESKVGKYPIIYQDSIYPKIYWEYYPKAGTDNPGVEVGLINISNKRINWITLPWIDVEYIARIDWSNSNELYIQTLNRNQNILRLYRYDIRDGRVKLVIEEKDPFWVNIKDLYYYFKDSDRILWYSERSGYTHLYLYDSNGKLLKTLTSGEWNVTKLYGVDEEEDWIYFASTKDSYLERHIYRVNIKSGKIYRLDDKPGTNDGIFSNELNYFLCINSRLDEPLNAILYDSNGNKITDIYKNKNWDEDKYLMPDYLFVKMKSHNGDSLTGVIFYPYNFNPEKKYPVLVYVYGGPHVQVVQNSFINPWHLLLTQRGYILFSLDNRGSAARGRDWERKIYLRFGKYELDDQLAGVDYLRSLPYIDTNRIGIWGWSFGGYMTLMALTKEPDVFKIGIAIAPVTDWRYYDTIYTERYMGLPQYNKDGYYNSSPINFVKNIKSKLFLAHGLTDDNVHFQNTEQFVKKLIENNIHFKFLVYPEKKHGIRGDKARIHLFEEMTNFIEENL